MNSFFGADNSAFRSRFFYCWLRQAQPPIKKSSIQVGLQRIDLIQDFGFFYIFRYGQKTKNKVNSKTGTPNARILCRLNK